MVDQGKQYCRKQLAGFGGNCIRDEDIMSLWHFHYEVCSILPILFFYTSIIQENNKGRFDRLYPDSVLS